MSLPSSAPRSSSPPPRPIQMLPQLEASALPPPPPQAAALRSIGKRNGKVQLSVRRSAVGLNNTLTILTSPSALKHRPSMPCFVSSSTSYSSSPSPSSPPRPAPRRGPLLQLQVTPPTPPKKRREDLIQALRLGEEWRVGVKRSFLSQGEERAGGLERWSGVKVSGLSFGGREGGGAMTVGRGKMGRGEIVAVQGRGGEGWF